MIKMTKILAIMLQMKKGTSRIYQVILKTLKMDRLYQILTFLMENIFGLTPILEIIKVDELLKTLCIQTHLYVIEKHTALDFLNLTERHKKFCGMIKNYYLLLVLGLFVDFKISTGVESQSRLKFSKGAE